MAAQLKDTTAATSDDKGDIDEEAARIAAEEERVREAEEKKIRESEEQLQN